MSYSTHQNHKEVDAAMAEIRRLFNTPETHKLAHEAIDRAIDRTWPFEQDGPRKMRFKTNWESSLLKLDGVVEDFKAELNQDPRFRNAFKEARKAWNVDEGYALDAYRGRTYDLGHYILNAIYEFMDDEYGPKKLKHNFGKRMQEWLDAAAKRIEDEDKEVLHMKWWGRY
jgi:hypothetical protein